MLPITHAGSHQWVTSPFGGTRRHFRGPCRTRSTAAIAGIATTLEIADSSYRTPVAGVVDQYARRQAPVVQGALKRR